MTMFSVTINAHVIDTASMDVHATTKFLMIPQTAVEMSTFRHQKTKNVSSFGKKKLKNAEIIVLLSLRLVLVILVIILSVANIDVQQPL